MHVDYKFRTRKVTYVVYKEQPASYDYTSIVLVPIVWLVCNGNGASIQGRGIFC